MYDGVQCSHDFGEKRRVSPHSAKSRSYERRTVPIPLKIGQFLVFSNGSSKHGEQSRLYALPLDLGRAKLAKLNLRMDKTGYWITISPVAFIIAMPGDRKSRNLNPIICFWRNQWKHIIPLTTYYASCLNMNSDVAERIASLLSSLRLTSLRSNIPQDGEDERLKKIHRQLEWLINEEPDDHRSVPDFVKIISEPSRRRRLRHILPAANCIHGALTAIMKESFEEEYRKLATIVGVLDAVAELLIFEVDVFDIACPLENRTIRKLIASTLTNLTFGNAQSKRRLCSHPKLVEYIIRIIDDYHGLAQVYAGLLRNLSWMADAQMSATLAPSVPALVRASLRAYRTAESKCLCATLSALWNLASHSRDNKKLFAKNKALVEPATGVLKYASMYLAVVGVDQYLSRSAIHMMMLRLIDLLNSPSFTVIGNTLGVLSQLLAKGHHLRSHILLNHKAMLLLNHLRNSTRDDIRNPVKTVLNYLNSFNVSRAYISTPPHPSTHGTPPLNYRFDGMSSSYNGTASIASSYLDSTRLLKYRSSQSYAASVLAGNMSSTLNAEYFPYSSPICASAMQQGFAPRPGDRDYSHHHEQFASLPRQFLQKNKISNASSVGDGVNMYLKQMTATARFSSPVTTVSHPIHPEQKDMSTSTASTTSFIIESSEDPNISNNENGEGDGLRNLNKPDDPSFEVEDSVRCTRCTSTQSLSSLFPGERSMWNSCNNSAADSNRLSPVSATEIPDSPTQCPPLANSVTLSAQRFGKTANIGGNETRDEISTSKEVLLEVNKSNAASTALSTVKPNNKESSSINKNDGNEKDNAGQENSLDDDYGSFMGCTNSELLNQSIEFAMPKRVEINEEFLADMIEQAQPKPSPLKQYGSASTARASSVKIDNDDFLLQSIASVLPQSSNFTHDISGVGSPPKKRGPWWAIPHAHQDSRPNGMNLKIKFGNKITASNFAALFDATLRSSLVESSKTTEKIRDTSLLVHQNISVESDTLSEDNYSPLMDNNVVVDKNVPQDIDEESQAEQLIIDCSVVSETVKQTAVKPMQKRVMYTPARQIVLDSLKNDRKEIITAGNFTLPTPLSNRSSQSSSPSNPIITSTPRSSKLTKSLRKSSTSNVASKTQNSCEVDVKFIEECRDRDSYHVRSLPRSKQSVVSEARRIATSYSSNSKIRIPRTSTCQHRTNNSGTSNMSQNCADSIYEKPQNILIQELSRNRSTKILPLNHRNVNEKTAASVVHKNDSKRNSVIVDAENDSGTQCNDQLTSGRKKTIKQMLVTTV
ncbi:BMA-APR-1, isoform a [Dirofilaria immitis]|nr:BMA-APR-1, isoform a [Dirofilaria immitis]